MPLEKNARRIIQRIVAGGDRWCAQAGIPVAGGHSIDTLEPIYGLVGSAWCIREVKRNDRAKAGDVAHSRQAARRRDTFGCAEEGQALGLGLQANGRDHDPAQYAGTALAEMEDVHALTDVTGFGLAGHLLEMLPRLEARRGGAIR